MKFLSREEVERLTAEYPEGTRVQLISMDDSHAPPPGTKGVVRYIDDIGQIFVRWDNGSGLPLEFGIDSWRVIETD